MKGSLHFSVATCMFEIISVATMIQTTILLTLFYNKSAEKLQTWRRWSLKNLEALESQVAPLEMVLVSMAELGDRFEALLQVESTVYCVFDNYLAEYVDRGLSNSRNAAWRTECIR